MTKIKDENYYQISGWMINRLNLKGAMLLVYAIIYGFSQDGECEFKGSRQYLCDFIGVTKPTIDKALDDLCKKNFITKISETYNNVTFNKYKINKDMLNFTTSKETLPPSKEILQEGSKETLPPSKETLPNNNINNNKENNKVNKVYIHFGEYGRIKLTQEQYDKLVSEHNKEYIDKMINALDEYVQSNDNKQKYNDFNLVLKKCIRENWFNIEEDDDPHGDFQMLGETDEEYQERMRKKEEKRKRKANGVF